ncbi:MAG TPA: VOC family protein [Gammaproteobacteria bacterium]|nr:VOC family protein [Gammaproteobacteria bacterium]
MHRSRLCNIVIDCLDEHFDASVAFWTAAFGGPSPRRLVAGQRYVTLKAHPGGLDILLQRVERDPGVHLDFESDSVSAESARLASAGARRKHRVQSWQVMQDPSGTAFCVIRKQKPALLAECTPWPAAVAPSGKR